MDAGDPAPDIHFTPTPTRVIAEMLRIAAVDASDVVFDLGCGDGRIVITAALERGAQGVGIDIDPKLLREAEAAATAAGVGSRVEFRRGDLFAVDLGPATVITLYLLDSLNVRLRPRIFATCRPGTRVVSYSFEMGEWEPDAHTPIAANGVSLWIVPANLSGTWTFTGEPEGLKIATLHLTQRFQVLAGEAVIGGKAHAIRDGRVRGSSFAFTVESGAGALTISGTVDRDVMQSSNEQPAWLARQSSGTRRSIEG
jgi:SAM-dependent methyltransferase